MTSSPAVPRPAAADASPFDAWAEYYARNPRRQRGVEAAVDWAAPCRLPEPARLALACSFQRFALGESGDGAHLLHLAERRGDPAYLQSVRLLVAEEQRHSALFERGLRHLGARPLRAHWSDAAFTLLRRSLGLDTEIALFLVAETVALPYFEGLAAHRGDPVVAGIGRRILLDERQHVRFQVDRLHLDLCRRPALLRLAVVLPWAAVAVTASAVLTVGHAAALRECGLTPSTVRRRGLRGFAAALRQVLTGPPERVLGPDVALPPEEDGADPRGNALASVTA